MDKDVKKLILRYKSIKRKPKEITKDEEERFSVITWKSIELSLEKRFPQSKIIIELLNTEDDAVVFDTADQGRKALKLTNLGFKLITHEGKKFYTKIKK